MSFLKANGIRGLVKKNDWPRYTEEEPEIYEQAELDKLFKVCDAEERLWFEFFLMTGMREQEVMYTYWSDVNFCKDINNLYYCGLMCRRIPSRVLRFHPVPSGRAVTEVESEVIS